MTKLTFKSDEENVELDLAADETVLDCLLRNGHDVPYGCQTGICQSCMLQAEHGEVPAEAQKGLRSVQKRLGCFLSCNCRPDSPLVIRKSINHLRWDAEVLEIEKLSEHLLRLRLAKIIDYRSGQYATLWKGTNTARSYSLVSHPDLDPWIEFHVQIYPNGLFSQWAVNELKVGDYIEVQGPMGESFYTSEDVNRPLFLSGIGTGLAPLYGIARDALHRGHSNPILLLVGAAHRDGVYYTDELRRLAESHPNLTVKYAVQSEENGDIYQMAEQLVPDFAGYRVFLAGKPSFVHNMKKQVFLAGASLNDITGDKFMSFTT